MIHFLTAILYKSHKITYTATHGSVYAASLRKYPLYLIFEPVTNETIWMVCQILFSRKNKKNIKLSSAEFAHNLEVLIMVCSLAISLRFIRSTCIFLCVLFCDVVACHSNFLWCLGWWWRWGRVNGRDWAGWGGEGGGGSCNAVICLRSFLSIPYSYYLQRSTDSSLLPPYHDIRKVLDL